MTRKRVGTAFYIATALTLGLPNLAVAQTTGGGQASSADQLTEVVVTARRVEERLQTVPISITVFTQQQLTDRNITSANDLATFAPSLSVENLFGADNVNIALRGFRQDSGTAPTVGVYFADVVAPRGGLGGNIEHSGDGAGPGNFFDLQNLQIVKGPQGTLFGRNTTGGALLLVPQRPTPQFEGYLEESFGNYGLEHTQAVINVPVNDNLRIRAGLDQEKRDGYMKNLSGIGPSDFNDINYVAGRVSVVADITDDLENYTVGSFSQSDTNGPGDQLASCVQSYPLFGALSCAQLAKFNGNHGYAFENDESYAHSYSREWQIANTTTWQPNDDLTVKNIASYGEYEGTVASSLFGTDWIVPFGPATGAHVPFVHTGAAPGLFLSAQSTFTEELQVHGTGLGGKLRWQSGVYIEGSHPLGPQGNLTPTFVNCSNPDAGQCIDPLGEALGFPLGNLEKRIGTITYRDYAAYGQATYAILENLKFTAGLRVTEDITSSSVVSTRTLFITPGVPGAPSYTTCVAGVNDPATCTSFAHVESRAPTWVMDLDYTPIEDLLGYVKYARGYRAGGTSVLAAPGYQTFQPEQVDNYELGAKYSFHGSVSGTIDLAGFYNDFKNMQLPVGFISTTGGGAAPTAAIANVGSSRIYGVELDGTLSPYKGLIFNVGYSYLNTEILQATSPTQAPGSPYLPYTLLTAGSQIFFTPHNKLSLTASYRLPVDESLGKITISTNYNYTGSMLSGTTGPNQKIPSHDVLDFNLNWESIMGSSVDAELFMTNAMDNKYIVNVQEFTNILGFVSYQLGEPRMFGGRVRWHFGGESAPATAETPYMPPPVQTPAPAVARNYMVFFDFNKSDLSPGAMSIVDQAAKNAASAKATTFTVTGHADTVGSDAYNMRLSRRRAESVAAQLEKDGISSSEIAIVARGKHDLLIQTGDGVREPQNRRVTIVYDGGPAS